MSHEFDHVEPSLDHRKHGFGIAISIYHHSVDVSEIFPMFLQDKVGSLLIPWLTWYQKHRVVNFIHWDDESKKSFTMKHVCVSPFLIHLMTGCSCSGLKV